MKNKRLFLFYFFVSFLMLDLGAQTNTIKDRTMTNPLNLSYQFYTDGVSHRTSADPVIQYFNGKYYLFGSHNAGYYSSPDLKTWTYIKSFNLPLVNEWAPAVMVYEGAIYYMAFNNKVIYKSTNPDADQWENINAKNNIAIGDPAFFKDDNGKVYLVAGCSSGGYIQGVELDPKDGFKAIGNLVDLIPHNVNKFGWEVPGDNNERTDKATWNEGPCLIKSDGLYYLQYATPGTEFASYSTGVYVSKNPLGPYTCSVSNPFATKLKGFVSGAGHGYTFQDKYDNYWYVTSMLIGVREHYERRLGIFPVYFDSSDGYMRALTVFSDFPFVLPDKKVDFKSENISAGMNLLSYNKLVTASSSKVGFEPQKATDESIRTWWSAATDNAGEWFQMDLGRSMTISSIQMNFADEAFTIHRGDKVPIYKYIVETSTNGSNWVTTVDRSQNTNDYVHELIVLNNSVDARYVRVTNKTKLGNGCFSIYDLRLFGNASGNAPAKVTGFTCKRQTDARRFNFTWNQQAANTRYVIRWGTDINRVDNAVMVSGGNADIGLFNADSEYYFAIDAFNESGITRGDTQKGNTGIDITNLGGVVSSQYNDSPGGEGIANLIDNTVNTKYLTFHASCWVQYQAPGNYIATRYTIESANDEPDRDPLSWTLQGSSNGVDWTLLDSRSNEDFSTRSQTRSFSFTNKDSYVYYRLNMNNNTGNIIQLAEFELFGVVGGVSGKSGTYSIQNRFSGLYMDVDGGSTANGANILQWAGHGGVNQKFTLNEVRTGVYSITSVASGKSVDVAGASVLNEANILQWTYVGDNNQQFTLLDINGFYKFKAFHSDKIIEVYGSGIANGDNIQQYDDNNQQNGQWSLISTLKSANVSNGISGKDMNAISIYPNPVIDEVSLINVPSKTSISVFDLNGRVLLKTMTGEGSGVTKIDVSSLKAGAYYIKIENEDATTLKLLKR